MRLKFSRKACAVITVMVMLAALPVLTRAAAAQPADLPTAKQMGLVGEQFNGLIGAVNHPVPPSLHQYITRINIGRMEHYQSLARSTGQPVSAIQARAGQNFILVTPPGQYYKNAQGQWVRQE